MSSHSIANRAATDKISAPRQARFDSLVPVDGIEALEASDILGSFDGIDEVDETGAADSVDGSGTLEALDWIDLGELGCSALNRSLGELAPQPATAIINISSSTALEPTRNG